MEDLLKLVPRRLVALVVGPFVVGVALLFVLVRPSPAANSFLFLVVVGSVMLFALGVAGMMLLAKQSSGLDRERERSS